MGQWVKHDNLLTCLQKLVIWDEEEKALYPSDLCLRAGCNFPNSSNSKKLNTNLVSSWLAVLVQPERLDEDYNEIQDGKYEDIPSDDMPERGINSVIQCLFLFTFQPLDSKAYFPRGESLQKLP